MKKTLDVYRMMQMVIICSFIGFVVEDLFKLVTGGYIDNRFMFLPFLLGYGLFIIVVYLLIGTPWRYFPLSKRERTVIKPWNFVVYFVLMFVFVSVGELALGTVVEKIGGFHYWDYSKIPLNFMRYVSLPTSLGFAFIITAFMGFVFDPIIRFLDRHMNSNAAKTVTAVVMGLLVLDFVASFGIMIATGEKNLLWKIQIFQK